MRAYKSRLADAKKSQEFPYLTITEAIDVEAGVWYVQNSSGPGFGEVKSKGLNVQINWGLFEAHQANLSISYSARQCFMLETISISIKPRVLISGPVTGSDVALRDDLWQQLLGKGKIAGDERFLIGENSSSEIVILHFYIDSIVDGN